MTYQQILASCFAAFGVYIIHKLFNFIYHQWTSPLHALPGPPNSSLISGNRYEIIEAGDKDVDDSVLFEKWTEKYGSALMFRAFFGRPRLYITDLKAINHIITNYYTYQRPEAGRYALGQILGNGVLVVEEDKHKQQRKIMNPAFGPVQIRELTGIFIEKSIQLRDIWAAEVAKSDGKGRVEVLSWLSKMTLDVIGLAGFNYKFNALSTDSEKNELNEAFTTVFASGTGRTFVHILRALFPALRFLPAKGDAETKHAMKTMARIGDKLLRESKASLKANDGQGKGEDAASTRRDLLSLLVKANTSANLPPNQRMKDEDVLAQVPTFLVAGHETTSSAAAWALFALTQNWDAQGKLRDELLTVGTDNPTMDELQALPYLDAVVRETLRVHTPVSFTARVATKDDFIPFGEPIKDRNGNMLDGIRVRNGETISIPLLALNRAKSIWGEDASEFKPERWQNIPEAASAVPGVWSNLMTFLGGPRACIGYRFSIIETKALLFTLIRAFEFQLAVAPNDVVKRAGLVLRPMVKSEPKAGNQMPLVLKAVNHI
ncbi:hypothetical protein GALMADRAFT_238857 [Galerina marginata CBS 339.88]|uniref:Cytochrome P450 n=1 Tax=Galerina marginata (strain CBS 339.88) TaxID=685588 RepID=A0A067TIU7_GALM3|nr:hypothetical protein GALMADRAFT_238857 [Galerina marginata CBS 339.88]